MNQEETRELMEKGQEAWNAWALSILERKKALEDTGNWSADWFGEGQNPETESWLAEAKADFDGIEFATDISFDGFVFPGPAVFSKTHFIGKALFTNAHFASPALFQNARFDCEADFTEAKFYDLASFDETSFASSTCFEKVEFLRETTGPLVPAARFQKARFLARADFRLAKFVGMAEFQRTCFCGNARFDEAEFQADAVFEGAVCEGTIGLVKTQFSGTAKFSQTQFRAETRASEAHFDGLASFEETVFADKVTFRNAVFLGEATFQDASFSNIARFNEARFEENAIFRSVKFLDQSEFTSAMFLKPADFHASQFAENCSFDHAIFSSSVDFPSVRFREGAAFDHAQFNERANFLYAAFRGRTSFRQTRFAGSSEFSAIQARAAFVLSGAHFFEAPSFHDASFREPPNLDHMTIADPLTLAPDSLGSEKKDPRSQPFRLFKACGDPEYAARYGRLRKLAAETHDNEREREFFAQELRCRRFWHDKPLGRGLARFWIGWIYGGISDFGRSIARPIALWFISVFLFSFVYLAQRRAAYFDTTSYNSADSAPLFPGWPVEAGVVSILQWMGSTVWWLLASIFNLFAGGGCIHGDGGASGEALFLSLKNSLFFLGWESQDAARRVYSCLYGFELNCSNVSNEMLVRVPLAVSTTAIFENMIGVMLIVLFLIAVRNLLRAR